MAKGVRQSSPGITVKEMNRNLSNVSMKGIQSKTKTQIKPKLLYKLSQINDMQIHLNFYSYSFDSAH